MLNQDKGSTDVEGLYTLFINIMGQVVTARWKLWFTHSKKCASSKEQKSPVLSTIVGVNNGVLKNLNSKFCTLFQEQL